MSFPCRISSVTAMACGLLLATATASAQTTWYVDDDASLAGTGVDWDHAFRYLQDALHAATAGDAIRVAGGSYKPDQDENGNVAPGERTERFALISGVGVYGGYRGCPEGDCGGGDPNERNTQLYESVLSGDLAGDDGPGLFENNADNSINVVSGSNTDQTALLDGLTITGGNANVGTGFVGGGGMYNGNGSPTVSNCTFSGNAGAYGGGMLNKYGSDPTVVACVFANNSAGFGGGMAAYDASSSPTACTFKNNIGSGIFGSGSSNNTVTNCVFIGNTASLGGGMRVRDATVTHSIFVQNTATMSGGGLRALGNLTMTHCTIVSNSARYGAGVSSSGTGEYHNCVFTGNTADSGSVDGDGGAVHCQTNGIFVNCLMIGNFARDVGGAISGNPETINCTFCQNDGGGVIYHAYDIIAASCLFWDNGSGPFHGPGSETVTYSDVQGGMAGEGNIEADPLFIGGPSGTWTVVATYNAEAGLTTLTDSGASLADDELVGKFLNPDITQYLHSLIVANTATTIIVWGDFSSLGVTGDSYQVNDYHLGTDSPCTDAGDNTAVPAGVITDFDGNPRFADDPDVEDAGNGECPIVDMGAYERQTYIDTDGDGVEDGCDNCPDDYKPDQEDCDGDGVGDECDDDDDDDGVLDGDDVCPLTPDCENLADGRPRLDMNEDCEVNGLDIQLIVERLLEGCSECD